MAEAKWYVAHTYSGYENKVKADLEKTIENRHLQDEILEVRVPMQDVVEMKNGAKRTVQKKLFPGYVLVNMVMNDDTWYVVRNTRGDGERHHRFYGERRHRRGLRRLEGYRGRRPEDRLRQTDRYHYGGAVRQGDACGDQLRGGKKAAVIESSLGRAWRVVS